jgi:hypothetical protein
MNKFFGLLAFTASFIASMSSYACDETTRATIKSFECGDNCYLTIIDSKNAEVTGLCLAEVCNSWNEQTAMPDALIGRVIEVKTGVGKQYDGSGNLMGEFPSFEKILFTTP